MILESQQEEYAFEILCQLADMATDRGCNDLASNDIIKFRGLTVESNDNDKIIMVPIEMDFQVIEWLKNQLK